QIRVGHGADGGLRVSVGILEGSDDFCFVGGGLLKSFRVDRSRSGSADELIKVVVRGAGMQKNLGDRADIRGRPPCVFIGGDGWGVEGRGARPSWRPPASSPHACTP